MHRIFILSPAHSGGERAKLLLNERAQFDLARRLRNETVPLGEVFSFLSGLYFRGKLAYANTFTNPPPGLPGALVITSNQGLLDASAPMDLDQIKAFSSVEIHQNDLRYRRPLLREAERIAALLVAPCEVILLGSVATEKYTEPLFRAFGERLRFPAEFVGRGDMSRGGLMLRCAEERRELHYIPIAGATRRGTRPAKLIPRKRGTPMRDQA